VVRGRVSTPEDRLRWQMIERVMCDLALDLSVAANDPDAPAVIAHALEALAPLGRAGLVELDGTHFAVTSAGRRFVRQVAACFDACLPKTTARHSATV